MLATLIKPKEVTVTDQAGEAHTYTITRFPATVGREIVAQWPTSATPVIGDYKLNHSLMLKTMAHVYVANAGAPGGMLALSTEALINSHCPDWECLAKVEMAMGEYNISFFRNGAILGFFAGIAPNLKAWAISTSMALLEELSRRKSQP